MQEKHSSALFWWCWSEEKYVSESRCSLAQSKNYSHLDEKRNKESPVCNSSKQWRDSFCKGLRKITQWTGKAVLASLSWRANLRGNLEKFQDRDSVCRRNDTLKKTSSLYMLDLLVDKKAIRQAGYWIADGRPTVARTISKCVTCRRFRGQLQTQKMSDLAEKRVTQAAPFHYIGMDVFGPFYVKEGRKTLKRYGLIFTCLVSRAVHLETLNALETDSFINALRWQQTMKGTRTTFGPRDEFRWS